MILIWGKARSHRAPNLGYSGGWVTWVIWCFSKKLCKIWDAWVGRLWWSCQSPVALSYGLLNHLNDLWRNVQNLRFFIMKNADSLLYSLSHFECNGHKVHIISQWCLPPPLISTVKLSLFMHEHSSPLFLAASLHWCHTNHSHYINNN